MRSSRALDAVRSLCVSAALAFPALAWGQVSCPLNEYSLDVSLPGGGLIFTGTGVSITVFVVAKSETTLAVYCEAAGGQFPPPTIAGASYRWSTGASEQRIRAVAPDAGQSAEYSVAISGPSGSGTGMVRLVGVGQESPQCTIRTSVQQPVSPGTTFTLEAICT